MNKIVKTFLGLLIILIPAAITLGLLFSNISKKSYYEETGDINIKGLKNNVKVYSDDYGVPYIFAETSDDAFFTMGYMHAKDRLWQMDIMRRAAEGRLSEVMGAYTLPADKYFRTIGLEKLSYALYSQTSQKTKDILSAYTKGVNAFIEEHYSRMPLEFDAMNYKPEPWKPENSLMLARFMGWSLNLSVLEDYVNGSIINKVGLDKAREIFPDTTNKFYKKPVNEKVIDTNLTKDTVINETGMINRELIDAYITFLNFAEYGTLHTGSNAWVISGNKTQSGKTMMCNDPHLSLGAPSCWYEAMMKCNEFEIRGMTMPGMPCVIIGNTRFIAWGVTSLMNDESDFSVSEKDSAAGKYKFRNTVYPLDSVKEIIRVKDSPDTEYTVYRTHEGAVVSKLDLFSPSDLSENENNYYSDKIVSLKWTGYEMSDEVLSFYNLSTAKNWDEFRNALKGIANPSFNFVYCDINGNIGYHAAGKIPIRKGTEFSEIYPSGDPMWSGFVDFDKMPQLYNPPEGFIMSANQDPFTSYKIPPNDKFYMSYCWESPSRFDRGFELISSRTKLDIEDVKLMQQNYESNYAREMTPYILNAFSSIKNDDQLLNAALDKFRNWKGEMSPREAQGIIFNKFFIRLLKNIYYDELGGELFKDYLTVKNMPIRSALQLIKNYDSTYAGWFDDISTARTETRDEIIRKSFIEAIEELKTEMPSQDINVWSWSEKHKTTFQHPLGIIASMDKSLNIGPFETGGNNTTLNCGDYNLYSAYKTGTFNNTIGPSMRIIMDFGNIEYSYSVNSTGQSGQPLHRNYQDQARLWAFGDYKMNRFSETELVIAGSKLMRLLPQ